MTYDERCFLRFESSKHVLHKLSISVKKYFQVNGVSENTDNLKTEAVSSELKEDKEISQGEETS